MESLIALIGENQVILFFLLFARLSGLFAFFPFFSHGNIPISLKTAITLFMVIFLFPLLPPLHVKPTLTFLALAIYRDWETDRKSTRLNSSHSGESRMPSSA